MASVVLPLRCEMGITDMLILLNCLGRRSLTMHKISFGPSFWDSVFIIYLVMCWWSLEPRLCEQRGNLLPRCGVGLGGGLKEMESLDCFFQVHMVWGCFVQAALGRGEGLQHNLQGPHESVATSEGPLEAGLLWSQTHCIVCLPCGCEHPWQSQMECGPRGMAEPKRGTRQWQKASS